MLFSSFKFQNSPPLIDCYSYMHALSLSIVDFVLLVRQKSEELFSSPSLSTRYIASGNFNEFFLFSKNSCHCCHCARVLSDVRVEAAVVSLLANGLRFGLREGRRGGVDLGPCRSTAELGSGRFTSTTMPSCSTRRPPPCSCRPTS